MVVELEKRSFKPCKIVLESVEEIEDLMAHLAIVTVENLKTVHNHTKAEKLFFMGCSLYRKLLTLKNED